MDAVKVRPCGLTELPGELAGGRRVVESTNGVQADSSETAELHGEWTSDHSFVGSAKVISSLSRKALWFRMDIDGFARQCFVS